MVNSGGVWATGLSGLPAVVQRVVFSANGRQYSWIDVIDAAMAYGEWAAVKERAAAGKPATARGAIDEWRRRRRLLSADDTLAYLAHWGLEMADVARHLGVRKAAPPDGDRATWVEAVCSNAHKELVWGLAGRVALAPDPPHADSPLDAAELRRLDRAFEVRRAEIESSDAVARLISSRALEWMRVRLRSLTLASRDAAREAALCVRFDGASLEAVGAVAGAVPVESLSFLDELDRASQALASSAEPGELLGPIATEMGHVVMELIAKDPPTADDPGGLERAMKVALRRAIDREAAARVVWHEHF